MSLPVIFKPEDFYRHRHTLGQDFWYPRDISRDSHRLARCEDHLQPYAPSVQNIPPSVKLDEDKFQVDINVREFAPHELTVMTSGDIVTVEGKHDERPDAHGHVARQFMRRYELPKGHDVNYVQSYLSSDGVLTITAPKVDAEVVRPRSVLIVQTGVPSKAVEENEAKK